MSIEILSCELRKFFFLLFRSKSDHTWTSVDWSIILKQPVDSNRIQSNQVICWVESIESFHFSSLLKSRKHITRRHNYYVCLNFYKSIWKMNGVSFHCHFIFNWLQSLSIQLSVHNTTSTWNYFTACCAFKMMYRNETKWKVAGGFHYHTHLHTEI